jgi:nicotinamidase-related amidase
MASMRCTEKNMVPNKTALILIGYQNDWFHEDGILRPVIEEQARASEMVVHSVSLITHLENTGVLLFSVPIQFQEGYPEMVDPVGVLATVRDLGAFLAGTHGGRAIDEIAAFGDRITELSGHCGINAFSNTALDRELRAGGIEDVVLAGALTSICIDTTARTALDRGFQVHILTDCIAGRTAEEHEVYCNDIFPLFCHMTTSQELTARIHDAPTAA